MIGALLSGGMDSAAALHWALDTYGSVTAFSVDYGQAHRSPELAAAKKIAEAAAVPLRPLRVLIPWPPLAGDVVPGRNIILLSTVAAQCVVRGGGDAARVVIGANAADSAGFPDCRPEFLAAAGTALGLGLGVEVTVVAPFVLSTKADIIRTARGLGPRAWEAIGLSWSCYRGGATPCGQCNACLKRAEGFAEAGEVDPWHA
jgi:7-cyano-7-deazaguanine synthase